MTASPILSKLALALRELGRVRRTLFTLEWLRDSEVRRRALAGLNKGEAMHTLKRAVAFHRSGEMRDRTCEAWSHRAGGLNAVVAAISPWNAVRLGRAVEALRAHGPPLGWEHIGLTVDSLRRQELVPPSGTYRESRR